MGVDEVIVKEHKLEDAEDEASSTVVNNKSDDVVKSEMKSNTGGIREKVEAGIKKRKDDIIKEINADKIAKEDGIAKHKRERYSKTDEYVKEIEAKAKEAVDRAKGLEKEMGVNFDDSAKAVADRENHPRIEEEIPKQQGNPD